MVKLPILFAHGKAVSNSLLRLVLGITTHPKVCQVIFETQQKSSQTYVSNGKDFGIMQLRNSSQHDNTTWQNRTRSYKQNSCVEFHSMLQLTNQISLIANFSFSDWLIFQRRVKFYVGIFIGPVPELICRWITFLDTNHPSQVSSIGNMEGRGLWQLVNRDGAKNGYLNFFDFFTS